MINTLLKLLSFQAEIQSYPYYFILARGTEAFHLNFMVFDNMNIITGIK